VQTCQVRRAPQQPRAAHRTKAPTQSDRARGQFLANRPVAPQTSIPVLLINCAITTAAFVTVTILPPVTDPTARDGSTTASNLPLPTGHRPSNASV
jgi:hypothetical protein